MFAGDETEGSEGLRQRLRRTTRIEGHLGIDGVPDGDDIMGIRQKLKEGKPLAELGGCFLLSERERVMASLREKTSKYVHMSMPPTEYFAGCIRAMHEVLAEEIVRLKRK